MTIEQRAREFTRRGTAARPETDKSATFWWRYMRWSGALLIPLAFGHLIIVHLINSVAVINYEWVIETRWSFIGWRVYDAFLLWFAGLHGYRGFVTVINDYVHQRTWNNVLRIGMIVLMSVALLLGTIALIGSPFELPS